MEKIINIVRQNYLVLALLLAGTYLFLVISHWNGPGYQERKASSTELSRVITTSEWFREHGLLQTAGIKDYTHYPETPTYIVYFLTKTLGFSPLDYALPFRLLTTIPLSLIAIFSIAWLFKSSKWNSILIIPLFIMVFQKGICYWSGNLEQEAYALSLGLLGIPLGLAFGRSTNYLIPFVYGFVLTSFSFDYSLVSTLTFTASSLIGQNDTNYKKSFYCFLTILAGSLSTLALHFIQVSFYYHSPLLAWNDLIGSALARANIMNKANPAYAQAALESLPKDYSYWKAVVVPISHLPSASSHLFRMLFLAVTGITAIKLWRLGFSSKQINFSWQKEHIAFFIALIGLFAWPVLFPNHAQIHNYDFIPRHSFIFFCFSLVLLSKLDSDADCYNRDKVLTIQT